MCGGGRGGGGGGLGIAVIWSLAFPGEGCLNFPYIALEQDNYEI